MIPTVLFISTKTLAVDGVTRVVCELRMGGTDIAFKRNIHK
jgi:hypothetical protein